MAEDTSAGEARQPAERERFVPVAHVVPRRMLAGVLAALLVLTFATVAATWVNFGGLNIWIAIGIATVKATLVALVFMHLAYDRPFNALVLVATLCFVTLFMGLALLDAFHYRGNIDAFRAQNPDRVAPQLDVERARQQQEP
jgi:cytochrome c oxidase subunit 4